MDLSFIEKLEKFNTVLGKYDDISSEIKSDALKECNILHSEQLKEQLGKVMEEGRLLNIGIIGRVKAGKSSLLNSLFFNGESILPEAATPMTAALTVMTYGEFPKAVIEFFTKADVEILKKEYNEWEALYKVKYEEALREAQERAEQRKIPVDEQRIQRRVKSEMSEHSTEASHDQYSRMLESGLIDTVYNSSFTATKEIPSDSIDDLMKELDNYVGANGKYMPFTKSVQLYLNKEELRDIQVVDTPGVNDPIKSREKRTQDFLGECDVVFVVSPSGQFMNDEDLNLMALSSGNKGIQQIYLVASQSDTQLNTSLKDDANGVLPDVISNLNKILGQQAHSVFTEVKNRNPEVGVAYDGIINDGEKHVIITSAICHAMVLRFNNKSDWSENMKGTWELLQENYPDYFTDDETGKANLTLLSGINKVSEGIQSVRLAKDKIIEERQSTFIDKQKESIEQYYSIINQGLNKYKDDMESKDIETIKKEKHDMESLQRSVSSSVDDSFAESVIEFKIALRKELKEKSKGLVNEIKDDVSNSETTETKVETHYKTQTREKKGVCAWIARKLNWGGYESYQVAVNTEKEIRTLRTSNIISSLNALSDDIQDELSDTGAMKILEWKKAAQRTVVTEITDKIGQDNLELISIPDLKDALRSVFNRLDLPEFNLSSAKYHSSFSGILHDKEIDDFINEFESYVSSLSDLYNQQISNYISSFESITKGAKLSDKLFGEMTLKLEKLEKDLNNKQQILERLNNCIAELSETN